MDITKTVTHVSLCAGYGGIDIGLKRTIPDLRTVAFAEIEAFACANLVSKMEAGLLDPAPVWTDLKTFPYREFHSCVDILSGGYPCQPFSAAGKRLGKSDPRHLWPWIADGILAMQPRACFFENVEGHVTLGLSTVISDLEEMGYRATWGIFSASEVGSPHQRKRVFILAHRNDGRCWQDFQSSKLRTIGIGESSSNSRLRSCSGKNEEIPNESISMADSDGQRTFGSRNKLGLLCKIRQGRENPTTHCLDVWPSRPGEQQHEWEPPRVVGNAEGKRSAALGAKYAQLGGEICSASASDEAVGNASSVDEQRQAGGFRQTTTGRAGSEQFGGQVKPALGGNADGPAGRLDDAELYVTSDNRTDELRLLGNGVVPATAERAFRVLAGRLADLNPDSVI